MKRTMLVLLVLVALVLALAATSLAPNPAEASGPVCPAPGTGYAGALNMIADATMGSTMANHTAPQGDAGMVRAVTNTLCPP